MAHVCSGRQGVVRILCGGLASLSVAVSGLSVATLAGCSSAQKADIEDTRLIGTWGGDSGSRLTLTSTGLYTLSLPDMTRPLLGAYTWDAKEGVLRLGTRRESTVCGDIEGTYSVLLSETTFDARVQRDACGVREAALRQPLKRVSQR
jgi:hypothetical protein